MAVLPPDPVFSFKADMGFVHSICFPSIQNEYTETLLASTESGKVYFWDLEVIKYIGIYITLLYGFSNKISCAVISFLIYRYIIFTDKSFETKT